MNESVKSSESENTVQVSRAKINEYPEVEVSDDDDGVIGDDSESSEQESKSSKSSHKNQSARNLTEFKVSQKDAKSAKTEIKGSNKQGKSDKISSKLSKADLKYDKEEEDVKPFYRS